MWAKIGLYPPLPMLQGIWQDAKSAGIAKLMLGRDPDEG